MNIMIPGNVYAIRFPQGRKMRILVIMTLIDEVDCLEAAKVFEVLEMAGLRQEIPYVYYKVFDLTNKRIRTIYEEENAKFSFIKDMKDIRDWPLRAVEQLFRGQGVRQELLENLLYDGVPNYRALKMSLRRTFRPAKHIEVITEASRVRTRAKKIPKKRLEAGYNVADHNSYIGYNAGTASTAEYPDEILREYAAEFEAIPQKLGTPPKWAMKRAEQVKKFAKWSMDRRAFVEDVSDETREIVRNKLKRAVLDVVGEEEELDVIGEEEEYDLMEDLE